MEAMEAIDRELIRLHDELGSFTNTDGEYLNVLDEIKRVNSFLMQVAKVKLTPNQEVPS